MNEWGFIDQDSFVVIGLSATINIFKQRCGFEEDSKDSAF